MHTLCGVLRPRSPINLRDCLCGGQSFRFKPSMKDGSFIGVVAGILIELSQSASANEIFYEVYGASRDLFNKVSGESKICPKSTFSGYVEKKVCDFIQIDVDISHVVKLLEDVAPQVIAQAPDAVKVRVLRQERVEALIAFITSANNNIERISGLVAKLCERFGEQIFCLVEASSDVLQLSEEPVNVENANHCYAFPSLSSIRSGQTQEDLSELLREMGFGYRAGYIASTVHTLAENEEHDFFRAFDTASFDDYEKCIEMLQTLKGVGRKVADCVALQGFGFGIAVPVDVHIQRISRAEFSGLKATEKRGQSENEEIRQYYQNHFGAHAGLAQQIMFAFSLQKNKTPTSTAGMKRKKKQ